MKTFLILLTTVLIASCSDNKTYNFQLDITYTDGTKGTVLTTYEYNQYAPYCLRESCIERLDKHGPAIVCGVRSFKQVRTN